MGAAQENARVAQGLGLGGGSQIDPSSALGDFVAQGLGLIAMTVPLVGATTAGTQANSKLVAVFLPEGKTVTRMAVPVTVAGNTVTHVQLGIYDIGLNLVASTADSVADRTAFQSTGWIELLLSTPYTVPSSGVYYLASAYSASVSAPTVLSALQSSAFLINSLPGGAWASIHAQAQGTLPAAPASQGTFTNVPLIVAR